MSCRRRTTVLRIPASALGFQYRREWDAFLKEHEDEFDWEPGYFNESLSDECPWVPGWREPDFRSPDWKLDQRSPEYPEIIPGPFLDYCLEEIIPLDPEEDSYGEINRAVPLDESEREEYFPLYRQLFPHFTMKDMEAVRLCEYEWYDGTDAPYLYSELE